MSIWRQNDTIDDPDKLTAGMTIYYVEPQALASAIDTFKKSIENGTFSSEVLLAKQKLKKKIDTQKRDLVEGGYYKQIERSILI